jgi:hypothetical protein
MLRNVHKPGSLRSRIGCDEAACALAHGPHARALSHNHRPAMRRLDSFHQVGTLVKAAEDLA